MHPILAVAFVVPALVLASCSGPNPARAHDQAPHQIAKLTRLEAERIAEAARVRNAIEGVLALDGKTGSIRDPAARVVAMRRIDISDCPNAFQKAYRAHIEAWNRVMTAGGAASQTPENLRNELRPSAIRRSPAWRDVRSSFAAVVAVASTYEARVPDED